MLGFFVLCLYWLAGMAVTEYFTLPIPGSVIGLIALWLTLVIHGRVPSWLKPPTTLLLRYLTLLYVPAGVGLMLHWDRLMTSGIALLIIIAISTVLAASAMVVIFKLFRGKYVG